VKSNNRINDLSVLFTCNNYCIALLHSIIIIIIIIIIITIIIVNEICMRNNSFGFMFDLWLVWAYSSTLDNRLSMDKHVNEVSRTC